MPADEHIDRYRERELRFQGLADDEARRSLWISRARLALFFGAVAVVALGFGVGGVARAGWFWAAGIAAVAFLSLVGLHNRIEERKQRLATLAQVNRDQAARVRRDWRAVPEVDALAASEHHPYAGDLDVLGHASLMNLLGAVATLRGIAALREWLLGPATPSQVLDRQQAVAELAPRLDFRQDLLAAAQLSGVAERRPGKTSLDQFLEWTEAAPWLIARPWLVWLARLLGASGLGLAVAHAVGAIDTPVWLLPVSISVPLWFLSARRIEHIFTSAFARNDAPARDARLFEVVCRQRFETPELGRLRSALGGPGALPADRAMRRLQRLMEMADIRLTALFHFPLNALTLWDFHVLNALERWQVTSGRRARAWFEAVGRIEALSALAGLRADNPEWALPEFTDDPVLEARALGHPLLAANVRVPNDVRVGPPGTFLFVTGSNMSGKSTLLRAIGVNAVLAQAGGPVCATSMRLPRVSIQTSMRVQDSLEEGVSYFMAALKRLKEILEAAEAANRQASTDGQPLEVLLYLLDEILQGTNTSERQIAVRTILKRLLASRAIGAVTSHDLNLADAEDLQAAAVPVHFTEHFEEGPAGTTMTFDYTLRPGVATSRNALKLMKMIGIEGVEAGESFEPRR
jgi:hypothetical protein